MDPRDREGRAGAGCVEADPLAQSEEADGGFDKRLRAEGELDFRGTLGVSREVPVGFRAIRLHFALDTDATAEQLATLEKLTERYCVVLQTLRTPPALSVRTTA